LHCPVQTKQTGWLICTSISTKSHNLVSFGDVLRLPFQSTLPSVSGDNQLVTKPVWVPDAVSKECMICSVKFTAFIRKHHCRRCGRVVCSTCSPHRMALSSLHQSNQYAFTETKKMERTCKDCFKDMSSKNSRLAGIGRAVSVS
jgi:hypothetical protein